MDVSALRYIGDRELEAHLRTDDAVRRAIEQHSHEHGSTLRRDLLARALRLTSGIAPTVLALVERIRALLGVTVEVEAYVYPSADLNAACTNVEDGRVFLLLSSSLVDGFTEDELGFVIGHELGHHLFGHHAIPLPALLNGDAAQNPGLAIELFAWQRAAEISSDRVGLVCTSGFAAAGQAMFKLTSGLTGSRLAIDLDAFLGQASELAAGPQVGGEANGTERDWFSSHPFSPLRVRALKLASDSVLCRSDGYSLATLDDRTRDLLTVMEPSYAREKSEAGEALRRLFFAAGIAVAAASDGIDPAERSALERFLGKDGLPEQPNVAALLGVLDERAREVARLAPLFRRRQLVRDLCIVARADGRVDEAERALLDRVAQLVGVPSLAVDEALAHLGRPLD